jgi:hypothetical protein
MGRYARNVTTQLAAAWPLLILDCAPVLGKLDWETVLRVRNPLHCVHGNLNSRLQRVQRPTVTDGVSFMVSAILPLAREAIRLLYCDHVEHDGESLFSSRLGARPRRNCGETEIRSLFTFTGRIAGESWGASNFQGRGVTLLPSLYHLMRPFPVQQKSQDRGPA